MKIQAAVARVAQGPFTLDQLELEAPRADEILVEIVGVGLCHTDLSVRDGAIPLPLPIVLGHEGSGIVRAVGANVRKVAPGDRVILSFRSCGHCRNCEREQPAYCESFLPLNFGGVRPDGSHALSDHNGPVGGNFFGQSSFADFALTYEANVVKVDEGVPLEALGPLGCGIQTGAGAVMQSLACPAGSSILITGGGTVGLAAVMGAVVQGCKTIILSEPHAARRELALSLGATHVIDPRGGLKTEEAVQQIAPQGVDYALDTTGNMQVLQSALLCLSTRGTLGLVAVPSQAGATVAIDPMMVMSRGLKLQGIVEGDSDPDIFLPRLVELFAAGRFPFDKLITYYPLADINRAVDE